MSGVDTWFLDRRTFLKVAGTTGAAVLGGSAVALGASRPSGSRTAAVGDALVADPAIDALAGALDYDTAAVFRFVSGEIRYEPYAGILRGASGTLLARAGNSADQAMLLAALLDASLVSYRFAMGPIDSATAAALMSSAVVDRATANEATLAALLGLGPGGRPVVPTSTAVPGRDPDSVSRDDAFVSLARDQLVGTVSLLVSSLEDAGLAVPGSFTSLPVSERQEHAWVQASLGTDWVDLDPSTPGATIGDSFGIASSPLDELPADHRHRVEFRVVAETLVGDATRTDTILTVKRDVYALAGQTIAFVNVQPDGLKGIGVQIAAGPQGRTSYQPCLAVGDDVVVGSQPIGFGGTGGPLDDPSTTLLLDGEALAQWVEVTMLSPDRDPVIVRRAVFDRLGPAARAARSDPRSVVQPADLVDLVDGERPDFLPAMTTHVLTVNGGVVGGESLGRLLTPTDDLGRMVAAVHAFHLARETAAQVLAVPLGVRPFLDAPNVTSLTTVVEAGQDAGIVLRPILDIWHRSYAVLPLADAAAGLPPAITAGVLGHLAERIVFGDLDTSPQRLLSTRTPSVGAVFDVASAQGIGIRVLSGAGASSRLPIGSDAQARLEAALAEGWIAIVPERPILVGEDERTGWWLVDRMTGRTVDEMDDGRGAELGEDIVIKIGAFEARISFHRLGWCVFAIALLDAGLLDVAVGAYAASEGGALGVLGGLLGGVGGGAASFAGFMLATGACG